MKTYTTLFFNLFIFLVASPLSLASSYIDFDSSRLSLSEKCAHIAASYKSAFTFIESNLVVLTNNSVLDCENRRSYNLNQKDDYLKQLANVSVADILKQEYPDTYSAPVTDYNHSPGRIRSNQIFLNTYLNISNLPEPIKEISRKPVLSNTDLSVLNKYLSKEITQVNFLGFMIPFNKRNGAAASLKKVSARLLKEFPDKVNWLKETRNMAGGFNLRFISGTKRLSSHSWGIALDLTLKKATKNLNFNDSYWKWVASCVLPLKCPKPRTKGSVKVRNAAQEKDLEVLIVPEKFDHFPKDIVRVFQEEGFIWGGNWNHFDTMHFEYRPEFFILNK